MERRKKKRREKGREREKEGEIKKMEDGIYYGNWLMQFGRPRCLTIDIWKLENQRSW
jgi:hypothetical protein